MKKFFLFIGALMLSVAMQATVATSAINLSEFTKDREGFSWNSETLVASTESTDWPAIQKWATIETTGYETLVLELATQSSIGINLWVKYSDNTDQSLTIPSGATVGSLALKSLSISAIKIILTNAGSVTLDKLYLCHLVGKETVESLFSGTHAAATDWEQSYDGRLQLDAAAFAGIHDGDKLSITYTSSENAACYSHITGTPELNLSECAGNMNIESSQASPSTKEITLHERDIDNLQTNGLYFEGINYTITNVSIKKYAQQFMEEYVLNTGNEVLDWEQHWVHTSGLPTLEAGDELRITVSSVVSGQYWQVNFRHNDNGDDAITFGSSDETTPKVYSFTLTAEQAENINNGKLLIVGCYATLSRFVIAKSRSIYDTDWHGEKSFDDSWSTSEEIAKAKFSDLEVGDRICVNVSALADDGVVRLIHNWAEFAPSASYHFNANHAAPMTVSFPVNQDMLDALQSDNLRVVGANYTMNDIYVQKATAHTESYTLTVSAAGMATLVLPFNVPVLPEGVKAYTLSNDGTDVIDAAEVSSLRGDKPVLIVAEAEDYVFTSELGGNADISGKNHWPVSNYENEALVGNYAPKLWVPSDGTPNGYNYILQNGASGVAFYQVTATDCTLAPYRAYLSCGYNANAGGAGAPMRIRFKQDVVTGVETVESQKSKVESVQKVLRDGQLYLMHNGTMYNVQGQIVK